MIDIETLLRTLGIFARYERSFRRWSAKCPHPDHNESEPSWSIIDNPTSKKHGSHYCFGCKFRGGPWELGAIVWGCTVEEAGKKLLELYKNRPISTVVPRVSIRLQRSQRSFELPFRVETPGSGGRWFRPALDYLHSRGITDHQIDKWNIGYSIVGRLKNRVVFPVYTEGVLRTYTARAIGPAMKRYDQGLTRDGAQPKRALWGESHFDYDLGIVTIAEGVPSALALERAGAPNPSAMLSSVLTPERARIISRFDRILVATDPDPAGDKVAEWINILSRRSRVIRLPLDFAPDDTEIGDLADRVKKALLS